MCRDGPYCMALSDKVSLHELNSGISLLSHACKHPMPESRRVCQALQLFL